MPEQEKRPTVEQVVVVAVDLARRLDGLRQKVAELHSEMDEATALFVGTDTPEEIRSHVLRAVDDVSTGLERLSAAFDNLSAAVGYYKIMEGD